MGPPKRSTQRLLGLPRLEATSHTRVKREAYYLTLSLVTWVALVVGVQYPEDY